MYSERFDRALVFAHQVHRKQARKTSGAPYMAHLLGVAALVMEDGGSEDEAIAALLHDSLEDQGRHYRGGSGQLARDIAEQFGERVLRLVEALTEHPYAREQGIADRAERWREHKRGYFEQILSAETAVRRISCADSLYNVRSLVFDHRRLGERLWDRFLTKNAADQVWAYEEAARAFLQAGVGPLAEELMGAVEQLKLVVASVK
jgi:(p)ppGpp synthase/HD superfamily hydrolase